MMLVKLMIYQALCVASCLLLLGSCNALTVHRQYNNKIGYHNSVSYHDIKLKNSISASNERIESSSNEEPNIIHQTLHRLRIDRVKSNRSSNTDRLGYRTLVSYAENERRTTNMHNLMHSLLWLQHVEGYHS